MVELFQDNSKKFYLPKREENKYIRYAEAKARIPKDLSAAEYEAEVKRLIKKFKI